MRRDPTMQDVADIVGVSKRTVSRVVRDEGGCTEETRQRILDAIAHVGYRPNLLARGLTTRRSGTVGVVCSDMTAPFFPAVAQGIQRIARETGLTMFFASTEHDEDRQAEVLNNLWSHAVEGVIVFPSGNSANSLLNFAQRGLAVVAVNGRVSGPNLASVAFDFESAGRTATQHLIDTRSGPIIMIDSVMKPDHNCTRRAGFRAAMADAGFTETLIVEQSPDAKGGEAAIDEVLTLCPDVSGIIAYNDLMAIGAIRRLQDLGRDVPTDTAVVGFDDLDISSLVRPALTTVRLDPHDLSVATMERLAELRSSGRSDGVQLLTCRLIVRDSA